MSISKNLFRHSSNSHFKSYLLIITAFIMLLSMVGCDACGNTGGEVQLARELDVTLAFDKDNNRKAVLTLATQHGSKEVALFSEFELAVTVKAAGKKGIGKSYVKFPVYNPETGAENGKKMIELTDSKRNDESERGILSRFFPGGRAGTIDFGQKNILNFEILPDMSSGLESITITVKVSSRVAGATGSKWEKPPMTITWQRSLYDFKIVDLDPDGVIQGRTCTLQVTSKNPQAPITVDDLYDLEVEVTQDHNDATDPHLNEGEDKTGKKIITFYNHELKDGKITKQLTVNPGTGKEKTTFTFALYAGNDENGNEADAVAIAKYQPVVKPYSLAITRDQLIGPSDKNFEISIKDAGGQDLKPDELQNLKLKIKRKQGNDAKISIDPVGSQDFEFEFKGGNALTLSDSKTAIKTLTLNTGNDLQAAFECVLVDSKGKDVADQQLDVQWEIGIEVVINYDNPKKEFQCELQNKTTQEIQQLKLQWEELAGTTVTVEGQKSGNKMIDIPVGPNQEVLKVYWPVIIGAHETKFKMTVTSADGVLVYQKEHPITSHAPHLSISLENGPGPFKVNDIVQLKIKADEKVEQDGLKVAKFVYKSSNSAELTINSQNVQGKNLQDLLELAGEGKLTELLKGAEKTISLTIDPQSHPSGGSFTELQLDGSFYDSTAAKLPEIQIGWVGNLSMTMKPAENEVVDSGALVANGEKEFKIVFTNTGEFPLDKEQLEELEFNIVAVGDGSKSPNQVLYKLNKTVDLATNSVTLWDIVKGQFKQGEDQEIEAAFTIEPGNKNLIEFTVQLAGKGAFAGFNSNQVVKWISVGKLVITTSSPIMVTPKSSGTELEDFSFEIQNNGPDLSAEDLKKIVVDFLKPKGKSQRDQGTTKKMGKGFLASSYRTIAFTNIDPSSSTKVLAMAAEYQKLVDDKNNKGQITLYNLLALNFGNVQAIRNGDKVTVPLKNIPISSSGTSGKDKPISVRLGLKDSTSMKVIAEVEVKEKTK